MENLDSALAEKMRHQAIYDEAMMRWNGAKLENRSDPTSPLDFISVTISPDGAITKAFEYAQFFCAIFAMATPVALFYAYAF